MLHQLFAVIALGQMTVVSSTEQFDILSAVVTTTTIRLAMMELEPSGFLAAATGFIHESTLTQIRVRIPRA